MKRMTITDEATVLYKAFSEQYSHITVTFEVVKNFVKSKWYQAEKDRKSQDYMLDMLQDWVLSQGLEEGVEL